MSIVISTFSAVSAEGVTLLVTFFCLKMQLLWKLPHSKQFCQLPSCPTWGRGRGQDRGQLQPERSHQRGGLLLALLPTSLPEKRKQMLKYLFLTSSFKKILCRNSIFYEVCHIVVKAPGWPSPHRWQPQHQTKARAGRLPGSFRRTILFWGWAAVGGLSEVASGPKINPCESNSS